MESFSLYYSRILSVPVIGSLGYILQNILYSCGLTRRIIISNKYNCHRDELLRNLNKKNALIFCKSIKFGRNLEDFSAQIILDVRVNDIHSLSVPVLYDLMWTLLYCKKVTRKTKKFLSNFLPEDYPLFEIIFIPFHFDFDFNCDFVMQTVKSLIKYGHKIYLIDFRRPRWILADLFFRLFGLNDDRKDKSGIPDGTEILHPLILLPNFPKMPMFAWKINRLLMRFSAYILIRRESHPILWSYDQEDLELIKSVSKYAVTLYDCVDYFTALDKKIKHRILNRENELVKCVHYFFVNSAGMKEVKNKLRKDTKVVPLGFDIDSFNISLGENNPKVKSIAKIFATIPNPVVGYVGNISYRFDFRLLTEVIKKFPNVSFVFTDSFLPFPSDDPYRNTEGNTDALRRFPNVYFIPQIKGRKYIKTIIERFDICIIPYDISLDFNKYCYPMKLFEYFYSGKPVISTPIEELKRFGDSVFLGKTAEEWEFHVNNLLMQKWPKNKQIQQREIAINNSWDKKVDAVLNNIK